MAGNPIQQVQTKRGKDGPGAESSNVFSLSNGMRCLRSIHEFNLRFFQGGSTQRHTKFWVRRKFLSGSVGRNAFDILFIYAKKNPCYLRRVLCLQLMSLRATWRSPIHHYTLTHPDNKTWKSFYIKIRAIINLSKKSKPKSYFSSKNYLNVYTKKLVEGKNWWVIVGDANFTLHVDRTSTQLEIWLEESELHKNLASFFCRYFWSSLLFTFLIFNDGCKWTHFSHFRRIDHCFPKGRSNVSVTGVQFSYLSVLVAAARTFSGDKFGWFALCRTLA